MLSTWDEICSRALRWTPARFAEAALKLFASASAWSITDRRALLSLGFVDRAENPANRLLIALGIPVVPLAEKFGSTDPRMEVNWVKCPSSEFCWRTEVSAYSLRELCWSTTVALEAEPMAPTRSCRAYPGTEPLSTFD